MSSRSNTVAGRQGSDTNQAGQTVIHQAFVKSVRGGLSAPTA